MTNIDDKTDNMDKKIFVLEKQVIKGEEAIATNQLSEMDKLIWGVDRYLEEEDLSLNNVYPSYKRWYEDISSFTENEKLYYDEGGKYFFVRKEMEERFDEVLFASEREKFSGWFSRVILVNEFCDDLWHRGTLKILHPEQKNTQMKMRTFENKYIQIVTHGEYLNLTKVFILEKETPLLYLVRFKIKI